MYLIFVENFITFLVLDSLSYSDIWMQVLLDFIRQLNDDQGYIVAFNISRKKIKFFITLEPILWKLFLF